MSEWKPIESAPKDETKVLVWSKEEGTFIACTADGEFWESFAGKHEAHMSEYEGWGNAIMPHPTHWMPLPEPPH